MTTRTKQYTDEERATYCAKCATMKAELKELAELQREDKEMLRQDHRKLGVDKWGDLNAGGIQRRVYFRAMTITALHIRYNQFRGRPYDMHVRRD